MDEPRRTIRIAQKRAKFRVKCKHVTYDGTGCYCLLEPQDPPVHGHTHYRTECMGCPGPFCVHPRAYEPEEEYHLRLLICGTAPHRGMPGFTNLALMRETVMSILIDPDTGKVGREHTIIHGGAEGADIMGGQVAREMNIPVDPYPAEWRKYGKSAGMIRNMKMLKEGKPDLIAAFYNGYRTPGTSNMVRIAQEAGIPTVEFGLEDHPQRRIHNDQ